MDLILDIDVYMFEFILKFTCDVMMIVFLLIVCMLVGILLGLFREVGLSHGVCNV